MTAGNRNEEELVELEPIDQAFLEMSTFNRAIDQVTAIAKTSKPRFAELRRRFERKNLEAEIDAQLNHGRD